MKNYVFVYIASGDIQEIKVFSSLEKAIEYAKTHYEDAEIEQDEDDENRWFYDCEDFLEILKLEIE
jgi:hypothetical protein